MHKSKGLESDIVLVIGMNNGWGWNFPSSMTNDPIYEMLLSQYDRYPFAEERRLFYVSMTRAKKKCYLIFERDTPSPFILELMIRGPRGQSEYVPQITFRGGSPPSRCEKCKKGFMIKKPAPNDHYFLGCSTFAKKVDCRNTINIPVPKK